MRPCWWKHFALIGSWRPRAKSTRAAGVLVPRNPAVTLALEHVMRPAGCGAFKDVFVLDDHLLVVKMMLKDRNLNTWADRGAEEEQARFEKYGDILSSRMAFCYGQVYLQSSRPAGQGGICSKESVSAVKKCRTCRLPMRLRPSPCKRS